MSDDVPEIDQGQDEHAGQGERAGDLDDAVEVDADVTIVEGDPSREAPPVAPTPGASRIPSDARQMAMLCHLLGLANFVFPFGGVIGPLVLWQMKREEHPFIDEQGREAVNFNLTVVIAAMVVFAVSAGAMFCMMLPVAFVLIPLVAFGPAVLSALAGIAANEGRHYVYPFRFEFVKRSRPPRG